MVQCDGPVHDHLSHLFWDITASRSAFRRRSDDRLQAKALPYDRLEGVFGQDSVGAVGGEDVAVGEVAHLVYNRTTAVGRNRGAKKGGSPAGNKEGLTQLHYDNGTEK